MGAKGTKHKSPITQCKNGHEFTPENTYSPPGQTKRMCRKCRTEISKLSHRRNALERNKRHRERRKFGVRSPSDTPQGKKRSNLQQIGWTLELFSSRMREQNDLCAVCSKSMNLDKKQNGSRACADHEHCIPPKPRGVICTNCNLGIGNLQDDPEIMRAAIAYVERWR